MKSIILVFSSIVVPNTAFLGTSGDNANTAMTSRRRMASSLLVHDRKHRPRGGPLFVSTLVDNRDLLTSEEEDAKEELLRLIRTEPQDSLPSNPRFKDLVATLQDAYESRNVDSRYSTWPRYNGEWENEHAPAFGGRIGFNDKQEPLYTIGTLTFHQIPAANHVMCSVQKMEQSSQYVLDSNHYLPLNTQHPPCPDSMIPPEIKSQDTYNPALLASSVLDTYFTTVHQGNNRGVKGIFRMQSYVYPHATIPNRFETWFVGGKCIPQPNQDPQEWQETFHTNSVPVPPALTKATASNDICTQVTTRPKTTTKQNNRGIVYSLSKTIQILFGNAPVEPTTITPPREELSYVLPKPIMAHQQVVYLDHDLRITVASRGTTIIVSRKDPENILLE